MEKKTERSEKLISKDRFRTMFEQSPVSTQVFSPDGRTIAVNRAWEELWGVTLEQIKDYNILADEQLVRKGIMPYIKKAFAGEATQIPAILYDPDQTIPDLSKHEDPRRWVRAFIYPIFNERGEVCEVVLMHEDITAQKRIEERLQNQLELTDTITQSLVEGILAVDRNGRITFANSAAQELLGWKSEELVGRPVHPTIHFQHEDGTPYPVEECELLGVMRSGKTVENHEDCYTRKDGTLIPVLCTSAPIMKNEEAAGAIFTFHDITERRRAQAALAESERQLRTLADAVPQLVWMANPDGYIFWYNQRWYDYTGTTPEEMQGWGWQSVHDPKILPEVIARWRVSLETGTPFEMEFPIKGADGQFRWFLTRVNPLRDSQGRITRWFGTNTDIDELRRAREAESEARKELETLNCTGRLVAAELDLHKIVQAVTDAATEIISAAFGSFFYNVLDERGASYMLYTLSGVPREKFANFPMPRATELFGPTFRGEGTILIGDVKKDPRYGKNPPYYGMPKGHLPVTSYLAVPVISRSGEVLGGLFFGHPEPNVFNERDARIVEGLAAQAAVAMDNARLYEEARSARERAEAAARENERLYREAQEANRLKDEFLAIVSHELRTPLTAILGWARLLATGQFDEEGVRRALETIERNAKAQAQIVEDILDVSRIITGKLRLDIRLTDPQAAIEAAVDSVRPAAEAKSVKLQMLLDPLAGPVSADPERLQQIVWNLLSNAIKFTPKGGRVQVRLERIDSHVEINVSDTGQGIPPEFLPFVFDRFRQADASAARRKGGLGLGLAIVKQLVEMHGGNISVASPGEGQGATFTVTLPLAIVHRTEIFDDETRERIHPRAEDRVPFDCPPELEGLRILAVDDEEDSRVLLEAVLMSCRTEVLTVASAQEALAALDSFQPDVIVSDIGMPKEDGYALIRAVRAREDEQDLPRVPAVALTAYARVEDRMRALAEGFQMHVPKPVEPAELVAVIASLAAWGKRTESKV